MIWKIVFSGVGGQGVISAGILLAETAVIHENRYAVQSQTYGAEMRGGVTRADVTISDHPVVYPKVDQAHVLVSLHRKALHTHISVLRPGGILIHDATEAPVTTRVDCRRYEVPIFTTLRERLNTTRGANIAALGVLTAITNVVGVDGLRAAIEERYRDGRAEVITANNTALDLGLELGGELAENAPAPDFTDRRGRHATSARL